MNITRRQFIRQSSALGTGALLPSMVSQFAQAESLSTFDDGALQIVSDGHLSLPSSFMFPKEIESDELTALLASVGMDGDTVEPDCNITVWRTGDRLVLFDVGAGPNFMPTAGKLLDNLGAAGIDPTDVTDVIFTHAHPDHLWGLLDDFDELICPEAAYHMSTAEWNYWSADDTLDKTPDDRKSFVVGAQNRFAAIEDRVQLFNPGKEIVPGVESVDTAGHTPGHTSFALHSGANSIMLLGDAITNVAVSFIKPEWFTGSDQDPARGAETRVSLLDRLSAEKTPLIGYHLPHPGAGFVERHDGAYRFVAEKG